MAAKEFLYWGDCISTFIEECEVLYWIGINTKEKINLKIPPKSHLKE